MTALHSAWPDSAVIAVTARTKPVFALGRPAALASCIVGLPTGSTEQAMSDIYDIELRRISGEPASLGDYRGNVLLVVNVASKCGLTPQYEGLEKLYEAKHAQGFEVLGFPANNFKGQEPGTDAQIQSFCALTYDVHFPMFAKISVKGADRHPLYDALTRAQPRAIGEGPFRERLQAHGIDGGAPDEVLWNFEKFLIDRAGQVVARFSPDVTANDPRLLAAVDAELSRR